LVCTYVTRNLSVFVGLSPFEQRELFATQDLLLHLELFNLQVQFLVHFFLYDILSLVLLYRADLFFLLIDLVLAVLGLLDFGVDLPLFLLGTCFFSFLVLFAFQHIALEYSMISGLDHGVFAGLAFFSPLLELRALNLLGQLAHIMRLAGTVHPDLEVLQTHLDCALLQLILLRHQDTAPGEVAHCEVAFCRALPCNS